MPKNNDIEAKFKLKRQSASAYPACNIWRQLVVLKTEISAITVDVL
jgi:hypothetical protein